MNMKNILPIFGILLFSLTVRAQTTAVSATIIDSDSIAWAGGSFTVTFMPKAGAPGPYIYNGSPMTNAQKGPYTGIMNGSGAMSVSLPDNLFITPSGSQWQFVLCPNSSGGCSQINTPVTGATLNLSTLFSNNVNPPRFPALGVGSYGYADLEVTPVPAPGGTYFNVSSLCNRQWTGSLWVCSTAVVNPVSGFGTTNFLLKYTNGASGAAGNSSCSDNGATVSCSEPLSVPSVTASGPVTGTSYSGGPVSGTTGTFSGAMTSCVMNGVLIATCYAGADIGAKVNTAIASADCPSLGCEIWIPQGNYSYSTQILINSKLVVLRCEGDSTISNITNHYATKLTWTGGASAAVLITSGNATGTKIQGCFFDNSGTGTVAIDVDNAAGYVKLWDIASVDVAVKWSAATYRWGHIGTVVAPEVQRVTSRNAAPVGFSVENVQAHTEFWHAIGYKASTNEMQLGTSGGNPAMDFHCYLCNFAPNSGVTPIEVFRCELCDFQGMYAEFLGNASTYALECSGAGSRCQVTVANSFLSPTDTNTVAAIHSAFSAAHLVVENNRINVGANGFAIFKNDGAQLAVLKYNRMESSAPVETIGANTCTNVISEGNNLAGTITGGSQNCIFYTKTIASGTVAMPTSVVNTLACGATATAGATGVLSTDTINWSFNAAPGFNPGGLTVDNWPTASAVNFQYCNQTAGNITPNAATLNWKVTR